MNKKSEGKHPGGRPLKFKTVKELEEKIDVYFDKCEKEKRPLTITGLALALDTTRETLLDYEAKDQFSDTVRKAKLICHNYAEESLWNSSVAGIIFNLKNNYGWKDKTEVDQNLKGNVTFINDLPRPKI